MIARAPAGTVRRHGEIDRVFLDANVLFSAAYRAGSALERLWNATYREMLAAGIPVRPGVAEALTALRARGLSAAVATSTHTPHARHKLEQAGILTHFDVVVGRDAVVRGKPAPDVYLHAAHQLGVDAAHCWAFEDSLPGVTAAVAAGARTHWVPDLAHIHAHELPAGVETIESLHSICHWLGVE